MVRCQGCKRRRKKCDLQRPVCNNCLKRHELCVFGLDWVASPARFLDPTIRAPIVSSPSAVQNSAPPKFNEPFTVVLSGLVEKTWESSQIVQHVKSSHPDITTLARHYPHSTRTLQYLAPCLRAIQSVYDIHRGSHRRKELLCTAYSESLKASEAFRHIEHQVNKDNWLSVLLFSLGHLMFQFATATLAPEDDFDYLQVFRHGLRGSGELETQVRHHVTRTPFIQDGKRLRNLHGRISGRPNHRLSAHSLELLAKVHLAQDTSHATREACGNALYQLRLYEVAVCGQPRYWPQFLDWPCIVSDEFVSALVKRDPVATLLFIHWCAIMHQGPDIWFLHGWAKKTALAAISELSPAPEELLKWPKEVFGVGGGVHQGANIDQRPA
ncbi:hypothetical protein F5Y18DRAFT_146724 [Xylariaceae sp. FL1019]|nr:hypothetical protein F5Y18DRAFT_146724 [Xylariaceae sp. FL1019]